MYLSPFCGLDLLRTRTWLFWTEPMVWSKVHYNLWTEPIVWFWVLKNPLKNRTKPNLTIPTQFRYLQFYPSKCFCPVLRPAHRNVTRLIQSWWRLSKCWSLLWRKLVSIHYLSYSHGLCFDNKPDYAHIHKLFHKLFVFKGCQYGHLFMGCIIPNGQSAVIRAESNGGQKVLQRDSISDRVFVFPSYLKL